MPLADYDLEERVKKELETVPPGRWREVLDFVRFLKLRPGQVAVKTVPASNLDRLTGLVDWGGDALVDSERLYDDCS
ncbi:MAG: hypothetical protein U9R72_11510 [Chloroflexota bacterium]|nr:hypothetical protein [Chloroflexota bacterium]